MAFGKNRRQHGPLSRETGLLVMLAFLAGRLSAEAPSAKEAYFDRLTQSDDALFTEDVLMDVPVRSMTECAMQCMLTAGCVTSTFYRGGQQLCRLYWKVHDPTADWEISAGARSFRLSGGWLGQSCIQNCDSIPSTAGSAGCFNGRCLCAPGYFYSLSRRACVTTCAELGNYFLRYEDYSLNGHDRDTLQSVADAGECKDHCVATPWCLVFTHVFEWQKCFFKEVTALDYPSDWRVPTLTVSAYQRTCT